MDLSSHLDIHQVFFEFFFPGCSGRCCGGDSYGKGRNGHIHICAEKEILRATSECFFYINQDGTMAGFETNA